MEGHFSLIAGSVAAAKGIPSENARYFSYSSGHPLVHILVIVGTKNTGNNSLFFSFPSKPQQWNLFCLFPKSYFFFNTHTYTYIYIYISSNLNFKLFMVNFLYQF